MNSPTTVPGVRARYAAHAAAHHPGEGADAACAPVPATTARNNGRSSRRKTVLFITHQIDEAVYLSDRIVVFRRRPGQINEIVKVDLPRPRPLSLKRSPEFVAYVEHIWRLIEDDVRLSVLEEGG